LVSGLLLFLLFSPFLAFSHLSSPFLAFSHLFSPFLAFPPFIFFSLYPPFTYLPIQQPEEGSPYHYGSHYSNSGSVLHFLLRIEPFSGGFLDFQGGKFDVPDRAFHSIDQTWRLSSKISFLLFLFLFFFFFFFFLLLLICFQIKFNFALTYLYQSSSDVKELIPEFFVLPEFLVNKNRFDFGKKQNGERVDDVVLPGWAKNNSR
jgi:Beige/BEACH domain